MLWILPIFFILSWIKCNSVYARTSLYKSIYSKYEGDIYLAAMFSIHHSTDNRTCGRIIDQDGLQVITAAIYGLELVKNHWEVPVDIGLLSIDTCQDPDYGLSQSKDFVLFRSCNSEVIYTCSDNSSIHVREEYKNLQRIFGVFGAGNSDVSILAATFLRLVDLPQVSYFSTSPELSDSVKYPGFFRTIPSDYYTVRAITNLLRRYKWYYILIVSDNSKYSLSTKESFISHMSNSNKYTNKTLCMAETVLINQDMPGKGIVDAVNHIKERVITKLSPKVIVTFLTQTVVEDLLSYIEVHPVAEFGELIWIGTDSWGGRDWPNVTSSNVVMNNTISVIPRAAKMDGFMAYYRQRRPAIDDNNPWMAEKFEKECGCQYTNKSLFIYHEVIKLREEIAGSTPCEPMEDSCSKLVFKNVLQMPYIHYVIDGIFAYSAVVKNLTGELCSQLSRSNCSDLISKNHILGYSNVTRELKRVTFIDSTNETFKFWKEKDGTPDYSLLFYNKSGKTWDIVGSLSEYDEKRQKFKIDIRSNFEAYVKTNIIVPPCSEPCENGFSRMYFNGACCWQCERCGDRMVVFRALNGSDKCVPCVDGSFVNEDKTACIPYPLKSMGLEELGAVIIFLSDIMGLLFCCFTFVIMTAYWKTPIIKAFGRETSSIILVGTVLSFSFSMSLLDEPNSFRCYMYWFAPAFCNTICYASILTKTNRIVRIFGMNWSTKKKANPVLISPVSQIGIISMITILESGLMITIIALSDVKKYEKNSPSSRQLLCSKMNVGNLVSVYLIPILLLLASTFYAFKMRKTPDGFNETRNINFMNFANCVVLITSIFLYALINEFDSVYPLCLQMTLSAYGNLIGLFAPKIYLVLCRPQKNTVECVSSRSRTKSQLSNSPATDMNLGNIRCRKCNTVLLDNVNAEQLNKERASTSQSSTASKTPPKVMYAPGSVTKHGNVENANVSNDNPGISNFAFREEF